MINTLEIILLKVWLNSLILLVLWSIVFAYNLNVDNVEVFKNPNTHAQRRGDYFGFSVALYTDKRESLILIGAPRANSTKIQSVLEPGTVYKCSLGNVCNEWIIDDTVNGQTLSEYPNVDQIKNNSWIGATIAIENKTEARIVVCGPRWKNKSVNGNKPTWFMNGICYSKVVTSAKSFEESEIQRILHSVNIKEQVVAYNKIGIYKFGMGQTGFSTHLRSDASYGKLSLGVPGFHNWKGNALLVKNLDVNSEEATGAIVPSITDEYFVQSGDYLGYTITSGSYFKEEQVLFASGAPRGASMHGSVIVFAFPTASNRRLLVKAVVSGEQHGEYFGSALTSCDLNGDGKEELIIGAPHWSQDVDEGRVYVYTARHKDTFERQYFDGEIAKGRFGSAVVCLGDIDYDDYGDIAVGAPHEGDNGAIYIFNGNRNGLPMKYSQKIVGSQFSPTIRGFGISISAPRDINGDNYSDIAVGAYLSEEVVLLQSRPVVTIVTKLSYFEDVKLTRNSTHVSVDICTFYEGAYVPESLRIIKTLKLDQIYSRAYLEEKSINNTYVISDTIYKLNNTCNYTTIYLKANIQNIIDPMEVSVAVHLDNNLTSEKYEMFPVVNQMLSKTEDFMKLPFSVECGDDDICSADLQVTVLTDLTSNKYIIGSAPTVKLFIHVLNYGEPAYQSKIHVYIPEILALGSIPSECTENNVHTEITCDVGNPLRTNKTIILELDMNDVPFHINQTELVVNTTTQSGDINELNNFYKLIIEFDIDIDIAIAGKTQEDLYSYFNNEMEKQLDVIKFQHIYEVQKFGASPIEDVLLTVEIPMIWKHTSGNLQIINITQILGHMDGQQFFCRSTEFAEASYATPGFNIPGMIASKVINSSTKSNKSKSHERFSIEENQPINIPPSNRTLYINCSTTAVHCTKIKCKLGSIKHSLSVAKLLITLNLQLSEFLPEMLEGKDIIFFVSNGYVNITQSTQATQRFGHKPDSAIVATTFLGSPVAQKVAIWIIVLSVFLGIILLILLIIGLVKIGFFHRKKKAELEALKAETDCKYNIVLETSSSREGLDDNQM